jgi:hypothetical protein
VSCLIYMLTMSGRLIVSVQQVAVSALSLVKHCSLFANMLMLRCSVLLHFKAFFTSCCVCTAEMVQHLRRRITSFAALASKS